MLIKNDCKESMNERTKKTDDDDDDNISAQELNILPFKRYRSSVQFRLLYLIMGEK